MFYRSGGRRTKSNCLYKSDVRAITATQLFFISIVCRTFYSEDMHVAIKILIGVGIATVLVAIVAIPVGVTVASGI